VRPILPHVKVLAARVDIRKDVPPTQSDQSRLLVGLGSHRLALTIPADLTEFFQVAAEHHSFLEELLNGRMEARQER